MESAFVAWAGQAAAAVWRVGRLPAPEVRPLAGDASARQFYRFSWPAGLSAVGMVVPPELAEQFSTQLSVYARLRHRWPVPAIWAIEPDSRWVLMEDAGEPAQAWVADALERGDFDSVRVLYRHWLELLRDLQTEPRDDTWIVFRRRLHDRWVPEFQFFEDHFLGDWAGVRLSVRDRERLWAGFGRVVAFLNGLPTGICHRDYHSRNILLRDGRSAVVDYQDMQVGPLTYDPVSLLLDCYVVLPESLVRDLRAGVEDWVGDEEAWVRTALQRHVKALGTFGYQVAGRGKTVYLPAMRNALDYLLLRDELAVEPDVAAILRPVLEDARARLG
jgi:N-acetylmuramate 1-kinase